MRLHSRFLLHWRLLSSLVSTASGSDIAETRWREQVKASTMCAKACQPANQKRSCATS